MKNKIFLVGFRTTGKTTIGKIIADKLKWSFLDMDFLITQQAGEDAEVLTNSGTDWRRFRKIENEILDEISEMKNVVISCGGGVGVNDVIDEESNKTFGDLNREILEKAEDKVVVLLISSEKSIKARLKRQYHNKKIMPFLNQEEAKNSKDEKDQEILIAKQIEDSLNTYEKRKPEYQKLTKIQINTDKGSLEKIAEEIIKYVR